MGNKLEYLAPEVDLTGKVAIVTGGNTGIGYETAKGLARMGAHTFIACRSKERAEKAIKCMKDELNPQLKSNKETTKDKGSDTANKDGKVDGGDGANGGGEANGGSGEGIAHEDQEDEFEVKSKDEAVEEDTKREINLEFLPLDLSSFQSTTEFVRLFKEKSLPLHILVNNAGIFAVPYRKTDDGYESQLQVNHLGPMLLSLELLPVLIETAVASSDTRIVFVSSSASNYQAPSFNVTTEFNPTEEGYNRLAQYCNTKLYNIMTAIALQRRLQNASITVSSAHPGVVQTEMNRGVADSKSIKFLHGIASKVLGHSPGQGAATSLNCAINPDLNSQQHFYYDSCLQKQPSIVALNEQFQEQLWRKSFEFMKDHLSPETVDKYGPPVPKLQEHAEGLSRTIMFSS